ncbi:hypothetical protein FSARC_5598 [Fusarium sarcochroum]|uniref:C2H2-type domain-containing protein n=1 Tax=Fusarium sarcochroum TaxID=1208366 RepID=A0A8H4TZ12_9HYPO|nr:hypothetical protein FSARC_5598 [Fusarium sarcochroum]
MEELPLELKGLGRRILGTFKSLADRPWKSDENTDGPSKSQVSSAHQRFLLWGRSLGLNQIGHASLDYRVRDATVVKDSLTNVLRELDEHLQNLSSILLGYRLPLEQDTKAQEEMATTSSDTDTSDDESSLSSISSFGSFKEIDFRLESVNKRIDSLYELALTIRSPHNRPQRPTKDLYKHIPEEQRDEYIEKQKEIEILRLAYVHRQQLLMDFTNEQLAELSLSQDQLLDEYSTSNNWLIQRTGIANSRRKQQILYWRTHAKRLAYDVNEPHPAIDVDEEKKPRHSQPSGDTAKQSVPSVSMATSATKLGLDFPEFLNTPEVSDSKSVISRQSRVSTAISPRGDTLTWPPPPKKLPDSTWFPCPYCCVLCPDKYLDPDKWRVHQIHDLQPYHCTYEDCSDPNRIYGSIQDWIDHENQHRRVWHCYIHEAEFETQSEYLQHLRETRSQHKPEDELPEMIAAIVGSSAKPHRDCPFCPTAFVDVPTMQKHIRYHLERLSLYVLPDTDEEEEGELASVQSSDSMKLLGNRGRRKSIMLDFSPEENLAFFRDIYNRETDEGSPFITEDEGWVRSVEHLLPYYGTGGFWPIEIWASVSYNDIPALEQIQSDIAELSQGRVNELPPPIEERPSSRDSFEVCIVCASQLEFDAVYYGSEEFWAKPDESFIRGEGDTNQYVTGRVGIHHVVLALIPDTGKDDAFRAVASMRSSYKRLRLVLCVGVCGGMPNNTDREMLLGDVVIGMPLVQYEFLRYLRRNAKDSNALLSNVDRSDQYVHGLANLFEKDHYRQLFEQRTSYLMRRLKAVYNGGSDFSKYEYPGVAADKLYEPTYHHKHHEDPTCHCGSTSRDQDLACAEASFSSCEELGCDNANLVTRTRTQGQGIPTPWSHVGYIVSGDMMIRSAADRDRISKNLDSIAYEAQGCARLWDDVPCLQIKGVYNYTDGHRLEGWDGYAAATAACMSKAFLERYGYV